jgi:SagB-type dehydrogenase family enzyme
VKHGREVRRARLTLRRSPHLVAYWRGAALHLYNYATRQTVQANPFILDVLNLCADWQTVGEITAACADQPEALVAELVDKLVSMSLLERSDRPVNRRVAAMTRLAEWQPEMGFFHAATQDVPFGEPRLARPRSHERAAQVKMPRPVKISSSTDRIDLERPQTAGEFADVLTARRTWRRFSATPIDAGHLATLLGLTAGIQHWIDADGHRAALKTSPSGGARHSIECYVVVRDVKGLRPGLFHYRSDRHALERLGGSVPAARIRAYLPGSEYFAKASALVFFTSVFERILWRYPYARAYRAALAETGHLCQTFCLTATWLGLAPFCLMALADSVIEEDLGLDGITEAVLYCAGVGRPPRGATWAALPTGTNPKVLPNPAFAKAPAGKPSVR